MLAMGNILGAVNVILLDFVEGAGGNTKKAQRMVHSHSHHEVCGHRHFIRPESSYLYAHISHIPFKQEAVRCLAWDEAATRLYSGCDGGVIVETRLPPTASGDSLSAPPQQQEASSLGSVGGALSLLGSAAPALGLGLGSTLASLFQGCSSAVWQREESEIIQVRVCTFLFLSIHIPLPPSHDQPNNTPTPNS
jgi:hypothetical protein